MVNFCSILILLSTNILYGHAGSTVIAWLICLTNLSLGIVLINWQLGKSSFRIWLILLWLSLFLVLSLVIGYFIQNN